MYVCMHKDINIYICMYVCMVGGRAPRSGRQTGGSECGGGFGGHVRHSAHLPDERHQLARMDVIHIRARRRGECYMLFMYVVWSDGI